LARRVLLVNPAVFDTKFLWARWQEPTLLAKISTHLRAIGADVRFVDATVNRKGPGQLRRERARRFDLDGLPVFQWRYGESEASLRRQLRSLLQERWSPDLVVVECFTTIWWRGAREAAALARRAFPDARIAVVGCDSDLVEARTRSSTGKYESVRAEVVSNLPLEIHKAAPDWTLGGRPPLLAYLSHASGIRSRDAIIEDIEAGLRSGVSTFAFCDPALVRHHTGLFEEILETVIAKKLKVRFVAPGTIAVHDFVDRLELLPLMRRAGFRQLVFSDDRHSPVNGPASWEAEQSILDAFKLVLPACVKAGFAHRTDAISAALSLGRPGENLAQRSAFLTAMAHVVGSVIVWPYQPTPVECVAAGASADRELQNGKLFPLRHMSGASYRDYLNVLGLAVVLNSKHREHTFDFMGAGLIASMFRNSLARRAWEPDASIKGGLRLPAPPPKPNRSEAMLIAEPRGMSLESLAGVLEI
jgi:hypothetical protein